MTGKEFEGGSIAGSIWGVKVAVNYLDFHILTGQSLYSYLLG